MSDTPSISGDLVIRKQRFAIVVSRFNDFISSRLLAATVDTLERHGCAKTDITVIRVPGAWELPLTAKKAAGSGRFDAVICLGCVIRGDTPHFDHVCNEAARGIAQAAMDTNVPVIFGVLTTNTLDEAINRAGAKSGNKGADAAIAAIEMSNLFAKLNERSEGAKRET